MDKREGQMGRIVAPGDTWTWAEQERYYVERIEGENVYLRQGGPDGAKPTRYPYPLKNMNNPRHWHYVDSRVTRKKLCRWLDKG